MSSPQLGKLITVGMALLQTNEHLLVAMIIFQTIIPCEIKT